MGHSLVSFFTIRWALTAGVSVPKAVTRTNKERTILLNMR